MPPAKLALEDGPVFTGLAFGATADTAGEVVFNTSMMGYQEVLTDPSYTGQIVTMTYPMIGNYGTTADDAESLAVQVRGFVVRELTKVPSNFRSHRSLDAYLTAYGVPGIEGIDTRALVRRLRVRGALRGVLATQNLDDAALVAQAQSIPSMAGQDLVKSVVPEAPFQWTQGLGAFQEYVLPKKERPRKRVVAIDYGMKWNILRCLTNIQCDVTVVPGTATADEVLKHDPDGIFLSNGPGDPAAVGYAIETVQKLLGQKPLFGICLGHQLLGLALGATTFKLKFGHRGANHPVLNRRTGTVEITTQNHGFAVDPTTLPKSIEPTHFSLNDQTLEGLRDEKNRAFSVQYHPESAAGPHDSDYLFEEFRQLMDH
ncbi:MAG: glutamine-hydrolyzing carbamoyl-phosphate synthase small subunit [Gemmataceae bacterium]